MMSKALGLFGIGVVGIGVYVVMGAMSETKIHARPVNATFAELTTLPAVPRGVSNLVGVLQSKVSAYTDSVPNQSVTWHFTLKGHEFGRYTASLSPEEADKTRVEFRFENVDPLAGENQAMPTADFSALRRVVRKVTYEQISAALDGRPMDREKIKRMQSAIAADPDAVLGVAQASLNGSTSKNGQASD